MSDFFKKKFNDLNLNKDVEQRIIRKFMKLMDLNKITNYDTLKGCLDEIME